MFLFGNTHTVEGDRGERKAARSTAKFCVGACEIAVERAHIVLAIVAPPLYNERLVDDKQKKIGIFQSEV